jgi:hypothetical protein
MSASSASPIGLTGRVSRHSNVDNLTVLNGAQGIGEIMNQVIGQAGPALDLARTALNGQKNGKPPDSPAP